jgi:hypothetical protein
MDLFTMQESQACHVRKIKYLRVDFHRFVPMLQCVDREKQRVALRLSTPCPLDPRDEAFRSA